MKTKLSLLLLTLSLAVLGARESNAQGKGNPNPGIVPPQGSYAGKTYGEYLAEWWKWIYSTQYAPMLDTTGAGAYAGGNGEGPVFFLAKSWTGNHEVREVTIPTGKALFIPVMGLSSWQGRLCVPETEDELVARVDSYLPDMFDLSVTIDGVPVAGLEDGNLHYLARTGLFPNILPYATPCWSAGDEVAFYSHEIVMILTPLPPGQHVIHMKGKTYKYHPPEWSTEVTYVVNVVPGRN